MRSLQMIKWDLPRHQQRNAKKSQKNIPASGTCWCIIVTFTINVFFGYFDPPPHDSLFRCFVCFQLTDFNSRPTSAACSLADIDLISSQATIQNGFLITLLHFASPVRTTYQTSHACMLPGLVVFSLQAKCSFIGAGVLPSPLLLLSTELLLCCQGPRFRSLDRVGATGCVNFRPLSFGKSCCWILGWAHGPNVQTAKQLSKPNFKEKPSQNFVWSPKILETKAVRCTRSFSHSQNRLFCTAAPRKAAHQGPSRLQRSTAVLLLGRQGLAARPQRTWGLGSFSGGFLLKETLKRHPNWEVRLWILQIVVINMISASSNLEFFLLSRSWWKIFAGWYHAFLSGTMHSSSELFKNKEKPLKSTEMADKLNVS